MFFGRFVLLKPGGIELVPHPAWVWNPHGIYDTHFPEYWPRIQFSDKTVGSAQPGRQINSKGGNLIASDLRNGNRKS
jgi:hypothetical protein